ncbi:type VI secretion system baseplate subunit TssF [Silvimonas iriomotensis]|uniref:Type VI secretion protein ImpG n=1 Tax=Silvimonas iriomotensis TaxID=449662 RepID=A0ABQ2P4U5_9NEIS|nr:type VI secretion system baseplate subunit TssF [Silvimonas iriomotensis]GGP18194.1 type VI secretion protein ImpG [Silvimonas iriomotensis]
MDDTILKYYEAEMRYLREAGREFAQAHPDRAALLNLDRVGERDPFVERLFEGFAFLTGRLRQKLDDDLPELTEGLMSLLWPHYLRMIPSLTVVELTPQMQALQHSESVPPGLELRGTPVAPSQVRCLYRTTQAVPLLPLNLIEASPVIRNDGRSAIRLRFALEGQGKREQLDFSRIRLFINADAPVACALRLALTRQVHHIEARATGTTTDAAIQALSAGLRMEPAGFGADERLWPKADNAFGGYQRLLEYFTFREKFMFLDLCGLQITKVPGDADWLEIDIVLNQRYPADMPFSAEQIRLHCTPAINLFELEAEPIRVDHMEPEYRVIPMLREDAPIETWSVDAVQSFDHTDSSRHSYTPFTSFRHRGGMLRHDTPERYFHTRVRRGASGLHDTWLVLGGHAWQTQTRLPVETLSLRVTGTNGLLPRKALRESQILDMTVGYPCVARVRNITAPTLPVYPPTEDRFHWRVLSHLAPNYLSLMDAEVLRGTLALYDWTDDEMNRRRLQGIVAVAHRPLMRVEQGCVLRGVEITVTLDSQHFAGEGDVDLFGELLHRFLAAYADMNLFTQLVLLCQPNGKRLTWAPDTAPVVTL